MMSASSCARSSDRCRKSCRRARHRASFTRLAGAASKFPCRTPRPPGAAPARLAMILPRPSSDQVGFAQRLADRQPLGEQEGVGDAAADDQLVHFSDSDSSTVSLVETLEPPTMATIGRAGCAQRLAQRVEFRRQQQAGAGDRREFAPRRGSWLRRGARCRRRRSRRRRTARRFPRERFVVLLLALVEAAVFQQHDFAGLDLDAVDPVPSAAAPGSRAAPTGACATGASESSALNSPSVGRPRCEVTITRRPCRARAGCRAATRGCACRR